MKKRTLELTGERTTVAWAKHPSICNLKHTQPSCQKTQICMIDAWYTDQWASAVGGAHSQHFLFSSCLDSSANESPAGSGPSSPIGLCSNENGASYRSSTSQIEVPKLFFWDYIKLTFEYCTKKWLLMTNNTSGMQLLINVWISLHWKTKHQSKCQICNQILIYCYRYQSFCQNSLTFLSHFCSAVFVFFCEMFC